MYVLNVMLVSKKAQTIYLKTKMLISTLTGNVAYAKKASSSQIAGDCNAQFGVDGNIKDEAVKSKGCTISSSSSSSRSQSSTWWRIDLGGQHIIEQVQVISTAGSASSRWLLDFCFRCVYVISMETLLITPALP